MIAQKTTETFGMEFVSLVFSFTFALKFMNMENILEKVNALYNKYGIRSVTMEDVARELGISKKTLYQYVNDKEDLVEKVMLYASKKMAHQFRSKDEETENAIEEIFRINRMVHRHIKETNFSRDYDLQKYYPGIYAKIMKMKMERMNHTMINNLKRGKKEGLFRKELDEEIITKMYLHRVLSVASEEIMTVSEFTSKEYIFELYVYHIRGVATRKGIEYLEANIEKLIPKQDENIQ